MDVRKILLETKIDALIDLQSRCVFQPTSGRLGISQTQVFSRDDVILVSVGVCLFVVSIEQRHYRSSACVHWFMGASLREPPQDVKMEWRIVDLI